MVSLITRSDPRDFLYCSGLLVRMSRAPIIHGLMRKSGKMEKQTSENGFAWNCHRHREDYTKGQGGEQCHCWSSELRDNWDIERVAFMNHWEDNLSSQKLFEETISHSN
eukprot:Gregarina_sp_Poly_1__9964@NODE_65_length_16489_cov_69_850445_g56_i0_p12_GENE_NODE_65_length_16489_cov_69_850445_g56_i0NODE_65_length_16489_cov_69_850445_g56_i0_p12_ORF_typecomplete_len109_score9_23_NODE_65_length_16489_cov_69_850445_g56_i015601886